MLFLYLCVLAGVFQYFVNGVNWFSSKPDFWEQCEANARVQQKEKV